MSRTISIFGSKKGWFGNISKKFVADIFVKGDELIVEAIDDGIKKEIISAVRSWENIHGNPYYISGDTILNKDGSEVNRTFRVRQSLKMRNILMQLRKQC